MYNLTHEQTQQVQGAGDVTTTATSPSSNAVHAPVGPGCIRPVVVADF